MTARDLIAAATQQFGDELRDALSAACGAQPEQLPAPRMLGNKLRTLRGNIVGDLVLRRVGEAKAGFKWSVKRAAG